MGGMRNVEYIRIGDHVTFVDPVGVKHQALVTEVWGRRAEGKLMLPHTTPPSINLVMVSDNPLEGDQYGRQIKRETSIVHKSSQSAGGQYWE